MEQMSKDIGRELRFRINLNYQLVGKKCTTLITITASVLRNKPQHTIQFFPSNKKETKFKSEICEEFQSGV